MYLFIKEVKEGGMPKFDVQDARGVKWRVKLGEEAQAETAASRLVWAAGYNTEESYYFNRADIDGAKVVFAREMDPANNAKLIEYFKSRRIWLLEPDESPLKLSEYPSNRPY